MRVADRHKKIYLNLNYNFFKEIWIITTRKSKISEGN